MAMEVVVLEKGQEGESVRVGREEGGGLGSRRTT